MAKRFIAVWDNRLYVMRDPEGPHEAILEDPVYKDVKVQTTLVDEGWFSTNRGYSERDRDLVENLNIGEAADVGEHPLGSLHWVLRVEDVSPEDEEE